MFSQHWWPGNVRQLRNEIKRAVALSAPGGTIEPEHLSPEIVSTRLPSPSSGPGPRHRTTAPTNLAAAVEEIERDLIQSALNHSGGNISETARTLGLTRRGLYLKLRRLESKAGPKPKSMRFRRGRCASSRAFWLTHQPLQPVLATTPSLVASASLAFVSQMCIVNIHYGG